MVLSAAITSRQGKVLLARQFVPMTRIRVESLLAAFPKLIGTATAEGSQHTFIETENVRYVYQPIEALYIVLITNKQSNIKEDLDTLTMIGKFVPEYFSAVDEESVAKHAFEFVFALDELFSIGHKEYVTLSQIRTFTEMDSHEEKLQNIILESKEAEQKHLIKEKAIQIDNQRSEYARNLASRGPSSISNQGFGSDSRIQFNDHEASKGFGAENTPSYGDYSKFSPSTSTIRTVQHSRRNSKGIWIYLLFC